MREIGITYVFNDWAMRLSANAGNSCCTRPVRPIKPPPVKK